MRPPLLYRGRVFTRALLDAVERVPGMWGWFTERQDYEGSAHVDTECIVLRGPAGPDIDRPFDCIQADSWWPADVLGAAYWDVLDQLHELVPHTALGRVMLVRLKPGGWVRPHVDEGAYAEHYTTRLHVAMTDSPLAYLRVGGEVQTFDRHECWSFNHRMLHEARNCDTVPRVHLIADLIEENDDDRRERERDDARHRADRGRADA